jgi:hypothetical protein
MSRDFDSPWKETLETFLPLILLKLFPQIHSNRLVSSPRLARC